MAASTSSHVSKEKLTDDFLSCSLCLERYKQPRVLICQHTYCLPCLHKYMGVCVPGMIITCPLCREETTVPPGNLSSLKSNFLVESLLSFVSKTDEELDLTGLEWSGQRIARHCQLCEENRETDMFCDDCKMWLCGQCSRTHNKLPATKTHRTLAVTGIIEKAKERLKIVEKELKQLHENMEDHYQGALMDQQFMSEQASKTAAQIEATWQKVVDAVTAKKYALLDQIAICVSEAEAQQGLKITQLQQNGQRIKKGLDYVQSVRKSTDVYHVTNMMGNVENLRTSVLDVSIPQNSSVKQLIEFHPVESLLKVASSSSLGSIFNGLASSNQAVLFPHDRENVGQMVHILAYNNYITGLAAIDAETIFVASNCSSIMSIKRISSNVCEEKIVNVTKPWGLVVLPSKEIIVTDCGSNIGSGSVKIFGMQGKFVKAIANGLAVPRGAAVDRHSRLFICDESDRCVYVMTQEGRIIQIIKHAWNGDYLFIAPRFVSVSVNDVIFVSDAGKLVKMFDDSFQLKGTYKSPFAQSEFWDVFTDSSGMAFIADWNHGIHVLSAHGQFQGMLKQPSADVKVKEPTAMCLHGVGHSLLVGTSNGEIISLKSQQTMST